MRRNNHLVIIPLAVILWSFLFAELAVAAPLVDHLRSRLAQEIRDAVPGDVELQDIRVLQGGELLATEGMYRIGSASLDGYGGKNRMNYSVELIDKRGTVRKLGVEVLYESLVDVFITAKSLSKGTILGESDFYSVRQRTSRLPVGAIMNRNDLLDKTLRINLTEGLVLKRDFFSIVGLVKRGQKVRVEIDSGSVFITTKGVLRSEGTVGSTVRVYCEASKKEIMGVLVSSDTVRIKV